MSYSSFCIRSHFGACPPVRYFLLWFTDRGRAESPRLDRRMKARRGGEAEEEASPEAEERARQAAKATTQREAQRKARREAKVKARQEGEAKARAKGEATARREAEAAENANADGEGRPGQAAAATVIRAMPAADTPVANGLSPPAATAASSPAAAGLQERAARASAPAPQARREAEAASSCPESSRAALHGMSEFERDYARRHHPWKVAEKETRAIWQARLREAEAIRPQLAPVFAAVALHDKIEGRGSSSTKTEIVACLRAAGFASFETIDCKRLAPSPLKRNLCTGHLPGLLKTVLLNGFDLQACSSAVCVEEVPGIRESENTTASPTSRTSLSSFASGPDTETRRTQ